MSRVEHANHWWRLVLVALVAGIFLPLMGMTAVAHAEDGPGHGGPGVVPVTAASSGGS